MEQVVSMAAEGEWDNFNGILYSSTTKEADFMASLLENCSSLPNELTNGDSDIANWPVSSNTNMVYSSDDNFANEYYFSSQSSGYSIDGGSIFFPSLSQEGFYPNDESHQVFLANNASIDYFMVDIDDHAKNTAANSNLMEGDDFLNQRVSNDSMESNEMTPESSAEEKISKKRSRLPVDVQRNKRSVKVKKNPRVSSSLGNNDDDQEEKKNTNDVLQRQNSISCCSEDDINGRAISVISSSKGAGNGKKKASRGSATDSQSLYARKRRERINERLRILQNLVPNGTKVDISTMLEEAVQYVKFLRLQIKLLSSDDLWMYAPIAYNGMDMGLDLKIAAPKS